MNAINRASIVLLVSSVLMAPTATALGADAGGSKAGSTTNLLNGGMTNGATMTTPFYIGYERGAAITPPLFALQATPPMATNAAKSGFADYVRNSHWAEALDWCANGSSNALALGVACCDHAGAFGDSIGLQAGGFTNRTSATRARTTFRFFDGAVISGGGFGGSGEQPDGERTAFSGLPRNGSWVGPDAAREPQGLRLFSWRW